MAKRSNGSGLLEVVALLPWWLCVILAAGSYLLFSALSGEGAVSAGPGGPKVNIVAVLAGALRYAVPLLFVAGAALSAIGRAQRTALFRNAQTGGPSAVAGMSWQEFELLVGEAFRRQGYSVTELGGAGADGGVDLVLRMGAEKSLVQCKHWKAFKVGVPVVRELLGAMTAQRATKGWVITAGRFTAEAEAFARQHGITLVDGARLPTLLGSATTRQAAGRTTTPEGSTGQPPTPAPGPGRVPACPLCSKPMVERVARKGVKAGGRFWGCSTYPACKGTRPGEEPSSTSGA